jgi:hypothetical protein
MKRGGQDNIFLSGFRLDSFYAEIVIIASAISAAWHRGLAFLFFKEHRSQNLD